jgi:hypothetical protein
MRMVLAGIAAIAVLVPFTCYGQLYKCVDDRGRTQFRDVPCKGMVKSNPTASPSGKESAAAPNAARKGPAKHNSKAAEARRKHEETRARKKAERRLNRYERDEAAAKAKADAVKRCTKLRNEYVSVSRSPESGPRSYLPDRAKHLARLRDEMRSCP